MRMLVEIQNIAESEFNACGTKAFGWFIGNIGPLLLFQEPKDYYFLKALELDV